MGYSTTFYAIDLAALRSAFGSNDQVLISRIQAGVPDSQAAAIDPAKGPRLKVTRDSQILINGKPVTPDEMRDILRDPKWAGTNLYWYQEGGKQSGAWKVLGSFMRQLQSVVAGTRFAGLLCCNSDEELLKGWDDEEELAPKDAATEIVAGQFTRPDGSYGYGLELLCQILGRKLGVLPGKGRLKALQLDSPLAEARSPVTSLPECDDFPYVSHLSEQEVAMEVRRLESIDLAHPKSAAIEKDRRTFLQHLQGAHRENLAVVSFYY